MSDAHVLAIDQGTTNTKALLVDRQGRIVASASRALSIRYPQPAWVEQDARDLWTSVREAVDACLEKAGDPPVAAIGISNQRESVVVWDRRTGEPAGPCVVWQCRRTAPFCAELRRRGVEALLRERTGLAIDPLFSASKARWLLEHIPEGEKRAANGELCIGTVDSWVLWNLSGGLVHACDLTNASRTQLLDLRSLQWDPALLSLFSIPVAALPAVKPSSHIFGESAGAPSGPGRLAKGIPIGSLVGDSHAALFGHAIFDPGAVKATYGTGSSLMTVTADPVRSAGGLSTTIAWSRAHQTRYALEGNISVTGGAVEWLGEFLGLPHPAEDAARLAASAPDSDGVYLVPAFVGLGAPHWNDAARGLIAGLTHGTRAPQVARATIESIAYQVRDVFEAMERDLSRSLPALLADGGASQNDLLMQFQADILGRSVVRSASADVSAMGAAWLAGLAAGVWSSLEELAALPRPVERFEPRMNDAERARLYSGWLDAVSRAVKG
jgi:glycerol kinase